MKKLQLAYFGTPDFAASFLENVITEAELPVEVKLVVTQPDKPVGRKQILTPTPVKQIAKKHGISLYEGRVKDLLPSLENNEFDLALLYAYGEIIPSDLIEKFPAGFWNIHPSLLPKYRNVAPMAFPLMLGDTETGVTMIQLDKKLDHGPIIAQEKMTIEQTDRRPDLERKLTELGFQMFKRAIQARPSAVEQDHSKATYTRMMKKDDGFIPFENLKKMMADEAIPAAEFPQILREYYEKHPHAKQYESRSLLLYNLFRGLYPWPGIWTTVNINGEEKRLKITDMQRENNRIIPAKVQLEGKNEVDFATFQKAYSIF